MLSGYRNLFLLIKFVNEHLQVFLVHIFWHSYVARFYDETTVISIEIAQFECAYNFSRNVVRCVIVK